MTSALLPTTPYTEQSNKITAAIDSCAAPADIVRTLGLVDRELFDGVADDTFAQAHKMLSDENIAALDALSDAIQDAIVKNKEAAASTDSNSNKKLPVGVVFAGCGTSGRVAFLCARHFNKVVGVDKMFRYIMAAGDDALVLSIELPEDDPQDGAQSLQRFENDFDKIIVVGVTCGLSAPFVAGMLDYAVHGKPDVYSTVALMGFNPAELARDVPIEKWKDQPRTCRDVFLPMAEMWRKSSWSEQQQDDHDQGQDEATKTYSPPRVIVITPIVGPEAITGSSRMKGGSATLMMLDAVLIRAHLKARRRDQQARGLLCKKKVKPVPLVPMLLRDFDTFVLAAIYKDASVVEKLGNISQVVAQVISQNDGGSQQEEAADARGRVIYCGVDGDGAAGAVGIMDASEMVDTYGCREDEWRALVAGGWAALRNQDGDRSVAGGGAGTTSSRYLQLDASGGGIDRWLRKGDLVVVLDLKVGVADSNSNNSNDNEKFLAELCSEEKQEHVGGFSIARITVSHIAAGAEPGAAAAAAPPALSAIPAHLDCFIALPVHHVGAHTHCDAEFALKLATNAVSTAAQIQRGAVFQNRMINVTVSNNKLFFRTLDMVVLFSGCNDKAGAATDALLMAIYNRDEGGDGVKLEDLKQRTIVEHVIAATPKKNVLPIAVLLASGAATSPKEAVEQLAASGTLRAAMQRLAAAAASSSNNNNSIIAKKNGFFVRSAKYPDDIPGAYHVCLKTGDGGADGEPFYKDDPDALGRVYVGPYMKFEEFGLILERESDNKICGYAFGCLDTRTFFVDHYDKLWRPELAAQFPDPALKQPDETQWTRAEQMHHVYHHPNFATQLESVDLGKFPSHLHIDLLEEARGGGIGRLLMEEVMRRLKAKGSRGVHLGMAAGNERAKGFYEKLGFQEHKRVGDDLFMAKVL